MYDRVNFFVLRCFSLDQSFVQTYGHPTVVAWSFVHLPVHSILRVYMHADTRRVVRVSFYKRVREHKLVYVSRTPSLRRDII